MKRKLVVVLSIISLLGGGVLAMMWFAGMKEEMPKNNLPELVRYVKVSSVSYSKNNSDIIATGRIVSQRFVDVIAEVQGKIMSGNIVLKKGQNFKQGDVLLQIFDDEADLLLQAKKSRFMNAVANLLPDFKIDFPENYENWYNFFLVLDTRKDLPDMPEIKTAKEKIYLSGRNIQSDYLGIKSDEVRMRKYTVYAPFNGVFTEVALEIGAIANPGSRIGKIIKTDLLELEVPVESANIEWIVIGNSVLVFNEKRTLSWNGKVNRKANFIDPKTQSMSIFITIETRENSPIYQGQYVYAQFTGVVLDSVMEVSRSAVFNTDEVFVVEDGRLKKKHIIIQKINQKTLLFNGLKEGDLIVTEALVNANENARVEIIARKADPMNGMTIQMDSISN